MKIAGCRIGTITCALGMLALHCWAATSALGADAGWVARVNGAPTVTRESQTQALKQGDTVRVGDRINTDETAKVKILLIDDSVLAIGPRSQVVLDELSLSGDSRTGRLNVLVGRFKIAIAAWLGGRSDYEVRTPTAVAGVRGTVLWGDTQLDAICALHGDVEIRSLQGAPLADLHTGKCAAEMGRGTAVALVPSAEDLAKYLKEVTLD
jgi:hypothetical protein